MKYLLSLILVTAMTCETIHTGHWYKIRRCENDEVICYVYFVDGGISCKFKEQEQ